MTDERDVTIPSGAEVGSFLPETGPGAPSVPAEQAPNNNPGSPPKKRAGAPKGNTNHAGKSLDKKAAMLLARAMKGKAKDKRTARRKGYENEARGIAEELRLAESYPMTSKRLQRALTDTAQEIDVCQALCENRGRYEAKTGKLKPWYETVLRLRERDLSIIQKAIDDLRALPAAKGEELFAGLLSITLEAVPAIGVGLECAMCGQIVGAPSAPAQAPVPAVLSAGQPDPPSEEPDPAERRVPRPVPREVFTVEPVEVVVTRHDPVPIRRGKRDFMTGEVLPAAPRDFNW